MSSRRSRIRLRRQSSPDAVPSSPASKLGPLSVSTLAGLVAAAFALFVLGTWLIVLLIRRKRRRNKRVNPIGGRLKARRLGDEDTEHEQKIQNNVQNGVSDFSRKDGASGGPFAHVGSDGTEYKFDPNMPLGRDPLAPASQFASKSHGTSNAPQSIILPSLSPNPHQAASPYTAQSSSWNSPSSVTPLYSTSPSIPTTPSPLRHSSSDSPQQSTPNVAGPSNPRPPMRARAPSQLSKSFSVIDAQEAADMPELPPQEPLVRSRSSTSRPRKLEKRRRSASLRRSKAGDTPVPARTSQGDNNQDAPKIQLHHTPSFTQPLSDSDQSTKTIVPSKTKPANSPAPSDTPPNSYTPTPHTLTRQRSGIRQPGDANHLRPPKEPSGATGNSPLSRAQSSNEQNYGTTISPNVNVHGAPYGQAAGRPQPTPLQSQNLGALLWSSQSNANFENDVLAYHKAAGNVPKPFKPFAFQFPRRSPTISTSTGGPSRSFANLPVAESAGNSNGFAALVAAAGLSSPVNSPSPSPVPAGRPPVGVNAYGDTLNSNTPWRPSTEGLTAFPPRSSTDALTNFGNGPLESRHSMQSGYSMEVPWETHEGGASSPSAFSFSTDLYGYGNTGRGSASNSIDLYRRVDPSTLITGASTGAGTGEADLDGRHSLSLLGGEPLTAAELDSRGLRVRRFREGHASVSSFTAFNATGADEGRSTRTPSWTLEALRENLFGPAHRRGQESVASSSVGSQRSSLLPWNNAALGVAIGPPALASPRDANFQFAIGGTPGTMASSSSSHPYAQWTGQQLPGASYGEAVGMPPSEPRVKTVVRAFAPLLPDELVLRPGEELVVLQEFDDGWCVVAREGLGSSGAPTPPGLDPDDLVSPNADRNSLTGSSSSRGKRVLEMGTCPCWVFDETSSRDAEFTRPMRSTSLGVTVSMRLPAASSPHPGSVSGRDSFSFPHVPSGDGPSKVPRMGTPIREEVISWSNF
ncbi:SubName: Full=Uncharacterized protein {ECO:0000313/EMBL:CCA67989.1} [Serendipita indica DSM 11827]|nr:SubName: Full=Uncharacterized protein {ECO:0000313/EMBL:CCA67989.1} [Serendipita indica DSM 11827]